jgi:hypothetical protein
MKKPGSQLQNFLCQIKEFMIIFFLRKMLPLKNMRYKLIFYKMLGGNKILYLLVQA